MSQSLKQIIKQVTLVAIASVVGVSVASAAGTWTAPPSTPPGGNVDAPLNVGNANQGKLGRLAVGTNDVSLLSSFAMYVSGIIFSTGQTINGGLILNNTHQGKGKILANDASEDPNGTLGTVTWTSPIESLVSSATGVVYWSEYEKDGGGGYGGEKAYKCQAVTGVGLCSGDVFGGSNPNGRLSRVLVSCSDGNPVLSILARSTNAPAFLGAEWWQREYIGLCMSGTPSGFAATSHWSN